MSAAPSWYALNMSCAMLARQIEHSFSRKCSYEEPHGSAETSSHEPVERARRVDVDGVGVGGIRVGVGGGLSQSRNCWLHRISTSHSLSLDQIAYSHNVGTSVYRSSANRARSPTTAPK